MAIAYVQSVAANAASVATVTTAGINTTTGNGIVIGTGYDATRFGNVTDNNGPLTWSNSVTEKTSTGGAISMREDYNDNITGRSGHTFTLSVSGGFFLNIAVIEFSGQVAGAALDQVNGQGEGNSSTYSSLNITTTEAAEILFGGVMSNAGVSVSAAAGWTKVQEANGLTYHYQVVGVAGTYSHSGGLATADAKASWISSYKEAAAAASAAVKRLLLLGVGT